MAKKKAAAPTYDAFKHPEATSPMRPDVGTQADFKKKKPVTYRYDSSLSPAMDWDGQNPAREEAEQILSELTERVADLRGELEDPELQPNLRGRLSIISSRFFMLTETLKAMSGPFLNWAGKAERLSFDVPTLPLFVHERLSTKAIVETLSGHRREKETQLNFLDLFSDPRHPISDQILKAYEYRDNWVNRMILGDSLVVMNSLLHFENLGGQVQMIYMDPPYGIKYGSNFQPFVRKRNVSHGDDDDMTREPEMVQAYRDTWELGLHSYLTYLRDRLLISRELLASKGSIFVQISEENVHHVREVMDEIFGPENLMALIPFRKKTMPLGAKFLESVVDYLIWYARDKDNVLYNTLYEKMSVEGDSHWNYVEMADGTRRKMTRDEISDHKLLPPGSTPIQLVSLYPAGVNQTGLFTFPFRGKRYKPPKGNSWFTHPEGMKRLAESGRIEPYVDGETLRYVLKLSDSPVTGITNLWSDTSAPSDKLYAVQTSTRVLQRCILMATMPGDLVLDPTCGGGTTAYVAEHWGRRWITIDASRVPLALARQRLLTPTFPYYALADQQRGPQAGFTYKRKQNRRGDYVGGIVPYISKGSIANNEPPGEEVLVDRPEVEFGIVRVSGPFTLEGTIPPPVETASGDTSTDQARADSNGKFSERMLEVLRKSPVLRLDGNRKVTFQNVRPPARSLTLAAEATQEGEEDVLVAFAFGPENGAVTETLVHQALREANLKGYAHLYVIGFAVQPNARRLIEDAGLISIPATYVQGTPDLMMCDLLKSLRSSQIFSVCGLPEVEVRKAGEGQYEVELLGLDVFDPISMDVTHRRGDDVPAWFLDTDYNNLCFHVCQAFFPRTSAWDDLKRDLKGIYDDSVWDHLAGTTSAPFEPGENKQIAVKVIDDRGNELLVVRAIDT
ncbi:MAG: DNA methyltransferase [Isosphaeraceae bacterium]